MILLLTMLPTFFAASARPDRVRQPQHHPGMLAEGRLANRAGRRKRSEQAAHSALDGEIDVGEQDIRESQAGAGGPVAQHERVVPGMERAGRDSDMHRASVPRRAADNGEGGGARYWGTMPITIPASALHPGNNTLVLRNRTPGPGLGLPYILLTDIDFTVER